MVERNSPEFSLLLTEIIEKKLDDKKAVDIISIDLTDKSDIADYMVVASGSSNVHVSALAGHVMEALESSDIDYTVDGLNKCDWVLIDTPYVIIHIFHPDAREYYNLEKMWAANFSNAKTMNLAG